MGNLQAAASLRKNVSVTGNCFCILECACKGWGLGRHAPASPDGMLVGPILYRSMAGSCVAESPRGQHPHLSHSESGQLLGHVTLAGGGSRHRTFWNNHGRKLAGLSVQKALVICTSPDNWCQGERPAEVRGPGLRPEE